MFIGPPFSFIARHRVCGGGSGWALGLFSARSVGARGTKCQLRELRQLQYIGTCFSNMNSEFSYFSQAPSRSTNSELLIDNKEQMLTNNLCTIYTNVQNIDITRLRQVFLRNFLQYEFPNRIPLPVHYF